MVNASNVNTRSSKFKQERYGISIVYGLPISGSILQYFERIKDIVVDRFPGCYTWYSIENLHSTLIRCKSKSSRISLRSYYGHSFIRSLSSIKKFRMTTSNITISDDGAIRLFLNSEDFPLAVSNDLILRFSEDNSLSLTLVKNPWITLANLIPNTEIVRKVNSGLSSFWQNINLDETEITVNSLKSVYFQDTGFNNIQILEKIGLGQNG